MNTGLVQWAHWHRRHLTDEEVANAQLPHVLRGGKRPTRKPLSWYPNPAILREVFAVCIEDLATEGKVWDWLHEPNARFFDGAPPIEYCDSQEGLQRIEAYAWAWRRSKCLDAALRLRAFSVEELAREARVSVAATTHVLGELPADWLAAELGPGDIRRHRLTEGGRASAAGRLLENPEGTIAP